MIKICKLVKSINFINLIVSIIGFICFYISIYTLQCKPDDEFCKSLISDNTKYIVGGFCLFGCILSVMEFLRNIKVSIFSLEDKKGINNFLIKKIKIAGAVAIFSRDFTWVKKDSKEYDELVKKAKNGELFLFWERETEVSRLLFNEGATVKVYEKFTKKGFSPKSRFTITNYKSLGTTLIGCSSNEEHTIYTLTGKENIEIHNLIEEYVDLLDKVCTPLK